MVFRALLLPLLVALVFSFGTPSAKAATFFGPIVPPECNCEERVSGDGVSVERSAASLGCVLQTVQNALNFAVAFGVILVIVAIATTGLTMMVAPTNVNLKTTLKVAVTRIVFGVIVVLCSWLIVDFVMKVLYHPEASSGRVALGPWNDILTTSTPRCVVPTKNAGLFGVVGGESVSTGTSGTGSTGTSGSSSQCRVVTSGPCAVSRMSAFGAQAENASRVCVGESSNGVNLVSGVDLALPSRTPVSYGLFQINLTAHRIDNLNCPRAFSAVYSADNHNVRIINPALFEQCKRAALDSTTNIRNALRIYNQRNSWRPWGAAHRCGIVMSDPRSLASLPACLTMSS